MSVIIGISMVRDEEDIVEHTVRAMAEHVDRLVVLDNLSTDNTGPILHQLTAELPLEVIPDRQLAYLQSRKLSNLARRVAGDHKGDTVWIVPFDADEVLVTSRPLRAILDEATVDELVLPWLNHQPTSLDDTAEPNPLRRMTWRDARPQPLAKVIVRYRYGLNIAQGNHSAWYPSNFETALASGAAMHHFPVRSADQLYRKIINGAAAYRAAGSKLPAGAGIHWKQLAPSFERCGIDAARAEFAARIVHDPAAEGLVHDPVLP